ncbi:TPA: glycine C-acetyltransferase [Pseudomonas aeruginosa]|uniref:glycine C-acetyltransferase n=2 Tax=Pseudomonas TaxID=286 RepID=UPI0009404556|nr:MULTISPECIES: glycine C-acetyltransferase [Pseudomonas]EKX2957016.1 glycine C-acetyltransferase [Pseudomonas aeruginosa]MBG4113930.1 glycine C-acetyltransferase [Pseudomonas aeruginosa]MBI6936940.1 glycine C-acetyltransferase [Pseudomonas aeruginosa]MBI8014273.1 glycine C-acetyltransferase [Pseudomonas aeruginosa]MBV6241911.1 glycine C-acetyltransferase [Pseudomonas aeruginosa]
MKQSFFDHIHAELESIDQQGLFKRERIINSHQKADVTLSTGNQVINLCANNYLGLADNSELIEVAQSAISEYGYGMASVRFICGTQGVHKRLEQRISDFLGMEDTILYSSCFDANTGLFETLLGQEDAIISDALNHASIIDGVRLCKAKRFRYANNDMADLEAQLQAADAAGARFKMIATDGVFSMDGTIANLQGVCDLAEKYGALVMVDDSHAVGFMGANGRGTHEHCDVMGRVDIITGTLGKALGGASGGYVSAKAPIVEMLRQRSRPYLFSNTLAPVIAATSIKVLDMLEQSTERRERLHRNASYFRQVMTELGFELVPGEHPIVPVMLGDAKLAQEMSSRLLQEGVYAIGFFYPVVPQGKARIRTQMSAALDKHHLDSALAAFAKVGRQLGVIK